MLINAKDFYKRYSNLANKAQKQALQSLSRKTKPAQLKLAQKCLKVFSKLLAAKIEQDKERRQLAGLLSCKEDA